MYVANMSFKAFRENNIIDNISEFTILGSRPEKTCFCCTWTTKARGGSRVSANGVHICEGVGVLFADFINLY